MKVALLLSGRFYGDSSRNRTVIGDIYKCNSTLELYIDTYMHIWEVEYRNALPQPNHILSLISVYNPCKSIVEDYNKFFSQHIRNTLIIILYHRKQTFKLVDNTYDVYIISRPDIMINTLSLSKYEYLDNIIYAYKCPSHASTICFDFCDWFYMCNYKTLNKIMNIDNNIDMSKSNEYNMKKNLISNGIEIILIGTVNDEVEYVNK